MPLTHSSKAQTMDDDSNQYGDSKQKDSLEKAMPYVLGISFAVSIAIAIYWDLTDSGLYGWLGALQVEALGGFSPGLTFAATFAALLIASIGVSVLLIAIVFSKRPE
jgi:hypothetical protein